MRFGTILVDPPWDYQTYNPETAEMNMPYPCMSLTDIYNLPVADIAEKHCTILLWTTWPFMEAGIECLRHWGFAYKSGFPWVKLTKADLPRIGTGYHARHCTEPLLIATKGHPAAPPPELRPEGVLLHRLGPHSRKPEMIYDIAEGYEGPYCELFARPYGGLFPFSRPNWTQLGNEIDGRDIRESLPVLAQVSEGQERIGNCMITDVREEHVVCGERQLVLY